MNGEKQKTNKLLADTTFNSEEIIYYLNTLNQRITKLQEIDRLKELNIKSNIEEIISSLKTSNILEGETGNIKTIQEME